MVTNGTVSSLGNLKDSSFKFKNSWNSDINLMTNHNRFNVVIMIFIIIIIVVVVVVVVVVRMVIRFT
jgi:hypothetical protein